VTGAQRLRQLVIAGDARLKCGMHTCAILLLTGIRSGCFADRPLSAQSTVTATRSEIDGIYEEDQRVREAPTPGAPKPVYKSDAEREAATRTLLERGVLFTGKDFEEAAVILQHSHRADDYLLAHTLAMVAMAKGDRDANWIAAASLDRYLMASGKAQIYGTQFLTPQGQPATQEPYDRQLISDALRKELGVPSRAEQEVQRRQFGAQ